MLAAKTVELSRQEILDLIAAYCKRVNRDPADVIRSFRNGHESDFEHLAEACALSELLADDDPIVGQPSAA